jgi:DUF1680 family protein
MAATSVIDPMTDLYLFTADKRYLDFCYYIVDSYNVKDGPQILKTLNAAGRVNKTANAKAYEMMSNLVGLIKLYKVTGDTSVLNPVLTAWTDIVQKRLYITGTTSSFEHFQDDHMLPATDKDNMGEGCVTTTWIQFNYQLLTIFGGMKYVDELERTVYNHLAGAENPQTGCVSYYTPLMGTKPYSCTITCCMSSVPRGIAMIPHFANGKIDSKPSFFFYQPGVYKTNLDEKDHVEFITRSSFPERGKLSIEVWPSAIKKFDLLFRRPYWAGEFAVSINGKPQPLTRNGTVVLSRIWNKGDKIDINFIMPFIVLNGGISYPGSVAFQRGPQVFVVDRTLNADLPEDFTVEAGSTPLGIKKSMLPSKWIGNQAYQLRAEAAGKSRNIVLVPYADASQTGGAVRTWIKMMQ